MKPGLTGLFTLMLSFRASAQTAAEKITVWQHIRGGGSGYSAVTGPETNILIQASAEEWLYFRNVLLTGSGAWGMALMVFLLFAFFLLRGPLKLAEPRSGEMIPRWSRGERWLHWTTALLFLLLAGSGLIMLFGRYWYTGIISQETFSVIAQTAKILHNYSGPLFIVGLLLMALHWSKDNLPSKVDIAWLKQFGGMIGNNHPSAGKINAGEKIWFWALMYLGLLISLSGLVLDFGNFGQERYWMQISHIIHTVSAIMLVIAALGHMYIGSIGTEGALEGMVKGEVDANWAKQHHDLWCGEVENDG